MMTQDTGIERRERIWEIAVGLGAWSRKALKGAARIGDQELDWIIEDWQTTGHLVAETLPDGAPGYRCNPEAEGPHLARNVAGGKLRDTSPHANIWRAMRAMPKFTARDIAMVAATASQPVTEQDVSKYAQLLVRGGYLRATRKAKAGRPAVYQLVADTGPEAPTPKRVQCIYDPNKDGLSYVAGDQVDV